MFPATNPMNEAHGFTESSDSLDHSWVAFMEIQTWAGLWNPMFQSHNWVMKNAEISTNTINSVDGWGYHGHIGIDPWNHHMRPYVFEQHLLFILQNWRDNMWVVIFVEFRWAFVWTHRKYAQRRSFCSTYIKITQNKKRLNSLEHHRRFTKHL